MDVLFYVQATVSLLSVNKKLGSDNCKNVYRYKYKLLTGGTCDWILPIMDPWTGLALLVLSDSDCQAVSFWCFLSFVLRF